MSPALLPPARTDLGMDSVPYLYRLAALAIFVALILLYDRRHPPAQRHRLREYSFFFVIGGLGAIFGMLTDLVTSSISPDYFVVGKGLASGPGFRRAVMALGAKAGFAAAAIGAGILLVVNGRRAPTGRMFIYAAACLASSALFATAFGLIQHHLQPLEFPEWKTALGPASAQKFTTVWCIHLGVYAGGCVGVLAACVKVRRIVSPPRDDG